MGTSSVKRANILDPVHDTLDPRVWNDAGAPAPRLKPQHKQWITREVMNIAKRLAPDPERWLRLVLTGSLTTYQYSDTSDCDVSLFINAHFLPEWDRGKLIGLMVKSFDSTRLPGTPFEMQCFVVAKNISPADLYQPGLRSGYDLGTDSWIIPPDRTRTHDVEREFNADYVYALESADKMERLLRYAPERAVDFWHQIHKRRMRDQRDGKGDFSQANVVYKMLANRGLFPSIAEASGEYIAHKTADLPFWRKKKDPFGEYRQPATSWIDEPVAPVESKPWAPGAFGKTMWQPSGVVPPWTTRSWGGEPFHKDMGADYRTQASAWIDKDGGIYFPYRKDHSAPLDQYEQAVIDALPGQYHQPKDPYPNPYLHDDLYDDSRYWDDDERSSKMSQQLPLGWPWGPGTQVRTAWGMEGVVKACNEQTGEVYVSWGGTPARWQSPQGLELVDARPNFNDAIPPSTPAFRTAMAERSGFPDLDAAINEFMQTHDVEHYRDPRNAWGRCEEAAEQLAAFLVQRGFKAYATSDELGAFPGYEHAQDTAQIGAGEFSYPEHAMVEVYGLPGIGVNTVTIDFTASQYGFTEFPKVHPGPPQHTAAAAPAVPKVIFQKFTPTMNHPYSKADGPDMPFIYAPEHNTIFLGPPTSYHTELVRHVPELKDGYSSDATQVPFLQRTDHVHGRMTWPGKVIVTYGQVPEETQQAIAQGLEGAIKPKPELTDDDWLSD